MPTSRKPTVDACCNRAQETQATRLDDTDFCEQELIILQTARYFFDSFAHPQGQSWILGFDCPGNLYGEVEGPRIAALILDSVQAMRMARHSCFRFNNPHCVGCSQILSEHERLFMRSFTALREGRRPVAFSYAMLLCEMNPVDSFLAAQLRLLNATAERELATAS
ncbi:hypothetical protein [Dinoroseobacter sp. S76]|uniref:hypothetical protein n=1 Tax=Dinoroseobacter sp. S76 TaxID=3415124 RepID=UPI003C7AD8D1